MTHPDQRKLASFDRSVVSDVRFMSYFPVWVKIGVLHGNAVTLTVLMEEPINFKQKIKNERVYQTAIADFFN